MLYSIPAHTNIVTDVKYQKSGGHFIVSSSYDQTVKVTFYKSFTLFHNFVVARKNNSFS